MLHHNMPKVKIGGIRTSANGNAGKNKGVLNQDDFKQIYTANYGRMFSTACRILKNTEDAEDAVQRAFLQLFKHYSAFRKKAKLSTYLHRIVINESNMILRPRERRIRKLPLEYELENGELTEIPELAIDGNHYGDKITIENAVNQLAKGYRKVWILHDYEGYEHPEVAELLRCSSGASKSQLFKARRRLREILTA